MLAWWLDNDPALRGRAERGELAFGTIDSWLVWKLTGGATHATSASNVSVSGAYDLTTNAWYGEWLEALGVPERVFPEVNVEKTRRSFHEEYGYMPKMIGKSHLNCRFRARTSTTR